MAIGSVAVFCSSQLGANPQFASDTAVLGTLLAQHQIRLVYGGGSQGLMGVVANAVLQAGGQVLGVIPQRLVDWEKQHHGLTETIVTPDMHTRKKILYERCDAAIVLPGGYGTMDELFEMLTWNQLQIHDKKIYLLNTGGFYDPLIQYLEQAERQGLFYEPYRTRIMVADDPTELMTQLLTC